MLLAIFLLQKLHHSRFEAITYDEPNNLDWFELAEAVDAADGLRLQSWVHSGFHQENAVRLRQVDAHGPGPHAQQENCRRGVALKFSQSFRAVLHVHAAVQSPKLESVLGELRFHPLDGGIELRENQRLGIRLVTPYPLQLTKEHVELALERHPWLGLRLLALLSSVFFLGLRQYRPPELRHLHFRPANGAGTRRVVLRAQDALNALAAKDVVALCGTRVFQILQANGTLQVVLGAHAVARLLVFLASTVLVVLGQHTGARLPQRHESSENFEIVPSEVVPGPQLHPFVKLLGGRLQLLVILPILRGEGYLDSPLLLVREAHEAYARRAVLLVH
mmetsp:Transcript_38628/g.115970  ORF Transcript_38628/g.115970 Transcript_38628/m.115970 type:complete len:334 (-) Transcript_38628:3397-4398(-)